MQTTYLPDLTHLRPATKWLARELPDRLEGVWVQQRYDEVISACDAAGDSAEAWIDIVLQLSELESFLDSNISKVQIAYRQDTDDADVTSEFERLNREVLPVVTDASIEVTRRVVSSPCASAISARFGDIFIQRAEGACRAHAPVNTALKTELSDVLMKHTKIFGNGVIEWRGSTHPFSFASKAALDTDHAERHAAWNSKIDYVKAHEHELQRIFDDAKALRLQMARNLDQPNYVSLRYLEMGRYDWDPSDAARVREAIAQHVVPIVAQLHKRQAIALGAERLHPADEAIMPEPAPQLLVEIDGQLEAASHVFSAMGEEFGLPWQRLLDERLVDLPARAGKGTGAFCSGFPLERIPFIFCNSVGAHTDVKTLVHEYGHALQGWRSRNIEPMDLRHATMEACEINSMSLELLAMPYMSSFFSPPELDRYRLEHIRSTIDSVPYMAAIDEFQHNVYEQDLDADGRADAWEKLARRFQPGIDWDADSWYCANRWLLQLHVFQYPFYYLDYALARIVSWEIWLRSLEDEKAAFATYLDLCDIGGTKSFRQMVVEAGLGDPFDVNVIASTMERLTPHLELDS